MVAVEIETLLGATYRIPDVTAGALEDFIRQWPPSQGTLSIVNVSNACLFMPTRIVNIIRVDGVVRWERPA